uniref:splenic IgW, short secretory form-like n=1 Tax=Pristiophorus japonicus TaxID=55135 RepID=UPI00398F1392
MASAACLGVLLACVMVVQSKPSVYIANPSCGSNSNQDGITFLCLVKDFQPKSIIQTWSTNGADITTGVKKYPAVLGQNMAYTMSSVLKVSAADWETNRVYYCKAGYKASEMVPAQTPEPGPKTQAPSLISLVPSPEVVYNQTTAVLGCAISGFYPDKLKVSWKKGGVDQKGIVLPSRPGAADTFETVAYLTVPVEEWTKGEVYTCEVAHGSSNLPNTISMRYQAGGNAACSCSGCVPKFLYQTNLKVTLPDGDERQYKCHQNKCEIK